MCPLSRIILCNETIEDFPVNFPILVFCLPQDPQIIILVCFESAKEKHEKDLDDMGNKLDYFAVQIL